MSTASREAVDARIVAAGGDPDAITLVAVTKGMPSDVAVQAVADGFRDLGENYAQELLAKSALVDDEIRWHFLGRLQRNKVRHLVPHVALWQSVDRGSVAAEIAKRAAGASVLVQVNISGEEQKGGCPREGAEALVDECRALGLEARGLMAVGPTGPAEDAREGFRWLRAEVDRLGLEICSMGMSGDLEVAVQEGTTMLRLGTALFGPRPPR